MEVTKGKISKAQKVVIYGPEGIGKSTFGSKFKKPIFLDVEGSTNQLDVARMPAPDSWQMVKSLLGDFRKDRMGYETLVIDTADWAERLCVAQVCAERGIESLGGAEDYGKSYNILSVQWGKFLDFLTELTNTGTTVVLLAHAGLRKFEQPDEAGAYDKYELKLEKKTSALTKEWADMVLFANYKTLVVEVDKKKKAQGGKRVMYASHHPCWDAKNRHDLPGQMDFDYANIAHCFSAIPQTQPTQSTEQKKEEAKDVIPGLSEKEREDVKADEAITKIEKEPINEPDHTDAVAFHAPLYSLMKKDGITAEQLQQAVAGNGYYPEATPIDNYEINFVNGHLIANWSKVVSAIKGI